jgi:hypothetical protein
MTTTEATTTTATEPTTEPQLAQTKKKKRRKRYSITITTPLHLELQANHVPLYTPALNDICAALSTTLSSNYTNVEVCVKECPDLTEWGNLADHGISGNCKLAEVGGLPYLFTPRYQTTTYEIPDVVTACGYNLGQALVFGGGQAANNMLGKNGYVIVNTKIPSGPRHSQCAKANTVSKEETDNKTEDSASSNAENSNSNSNSNNNSGSGSSNSKSTSRSSVHSPRISPSKDTKIVASYPSDEHGCASNLFLCDGAVGEVIHIKASVRTGELTIAQAIQTALQSVDGCGTDSQQIGVGCVIKVLNGQIRGSVQGNFVTCEDWQSKEAQQEINESWTTYFECDPNVVMFSCILSGDPSSANTSAKDMHLTLNSTHFYSLTKNSNQAGKYECDLTPEIIEYEAYLSVAESIYRIEDAYYNLSLLGK